MGYLFDEKQSSTINFADNADIKFYKEEIARLQSLLNSTKSTKVLVELEVDNDEFIKMGLKDKVIQILSKKYE